LFGNQSGKQSGESRHHCGVSPTCYYRPMSRTSDLHPTVVEQHDLWGGISVITLYKSGTRVRASTLSGVSPERVATLVRTTIAQEGATQLAAKARRAR
jgi:hypothetical protein